MCITAIRKEIRDVEEGKMDQRMNPIKVSKKSSQNIHEPNQSKQEKQSK